MAPRYVTMETEDMLAHQDFIASGATNVEKETKKDVYIE